MIRMLKIALVSLLMLTLLLVLVVLFWLGPAVKAIAQGLGSKALGVPVTVEHLSINPRKGTIHLDGFAIANHEGFGRSNTVSLANLDIAIDMGSIFTETVVVHKVQIDSPHFTYEQNGTTDNIVEFIRNIQDFAGIDPNEPKKEKPKKEDKTPKEPKKVVVQALEINDVQFHLANTHDPLLDIGLGLEQLAGSMTNGTVQLKNLTIGNPGRLETPNLFTLDGIDIKLDPATIYSDRISILDMRVFNPYAYLERNQETDTVAEFMKISDGITSRMATKPAPTNVVETTPPQEPPASSTTIDLHNLLIDDIQLKLLDSTQTHAPAQPAMLAGIRSISVRLVDGKIQLKGITIPNPADFQATHLFHLAKVDVALDPASIFSDQVVIQQVFVDSPTINLEQTETIGNVATLQESLMAFVPPAQENAAEPDKAVSAATTNTAIPMAEQPVLLESLLVTNLAIFAILPPPAHTATNTSSISSFGKMELQKLNPMTHVKQSETNGSSTVELEEISLLAFDLLTIEPLKGTVAISNMQIGNPPGFANKNLVMFEQFRLQLDPDSLLSDTLLIKEIKIEKPRVAYEREIMTDNIKVFQQIIENAVVRREDAMENVGEKHEVEADDGQKVIIEQLLVQNGIVKAKISALPTVPIPLPTIEIKDLGKAEGGTSLGEATTQIFSTFYDSIIGVVANTTGIAGDALKGAGMFSLDILGNVTGSFGELVGMEKKEAAEPGTEPPPEKKKHRLFKRRLFPR